MDVDQIKKILSSCVIDMSRYSSTDIKQFSSSSDIVEAMKSINHIKEEIMEKWKIQASIIDFKNSRLSLSNGTQNEKYSYTFSEDFLSANKLTYFNITQLEETGLKFSKEAMELTGTPTVSGDIPVQLEFSVHGEDKELKRHIKTINLVVNPDPKTLWKNIPSDKDALFWKKDDKSSSSKIGDKSIVISSKRGRSHQNVGSFRDDDYSYKYFSRTGWTVVAVSDGAGSAKLSRKGSQIACNSVIDHFENHTSILELLRFEKKLNSYSINRTDNELQELTVIAKRALYQVTLHVHQKLNEIAQKTFDDLKEVFDNSKAKNIVDYFYSTLIFAVFKKFDFGYLILTFGVGDCPIAVINKDQSSVELLNYLDVGEFGGGTRFITQNDIFHNKERPMSDRFNMYIIEDFSFLYLMTDGIYDPKFIVEANLEKIQKWNEFIGDLGGNNDDNISVDFNQELSIVEGQLNNWMDFWSKGNHDDRTLAIIF